MERPPVRELPTDDAKTVYDALASVEKAIDRERQNISSATEDSLRLARWDPFDHLEEVARAMRREAGRRLTASLQRETNRAGVLHE